MYDREIALQRMEYLTKKIESSEPFNMSVDGYAPNIYKFIEGQLYIKNYFQDTYVITYITLNDLLTTQYRLTI